MELRACCLTLVVEVGALLALAFCVGRISADCWSQSSLPWSYLSQNISLIMKLILRKGTLAAMGLAAALLLSAPCDVAARSAGGGVTIISSTGEINKSSSPIPSSSSGVVAIVTSPGRTDPYFALAGGDSVSAVGAGGAGQPVIITAPGATLAGGVDAHSLHCGSGAAAAAAIAGSVILTGVTEGDVQAGLGSTRHGRTLSAVFTNRLARYKPEEAEDESAKTLLIVAVSAEGGSGDLDTDTIEESARLMFVEAAASVGAKVEFDALFEVNVVPVASEGDAAKVRTTMLP